jgi:hypothetical protein
MFSGGSASGSSPPAISSPKSSRSWRCHRSCLLLVVVGGVQPRGGWHSSAIAQLQGFSSRSPVATSGRWSSTRMTTSLVVETSEPDCGLPLPSASRMFIIRAGEEGEPSRGSASRVGWRPAYSSNIRGRRAFASPAKEANFGYAGSAVCGAVSCHVPGSSAWVALVPPPTLPPATWMGRGCPSTAWATVASCAGWPHPRLLSRRRPHRGDVQDIICRGGGGGVLGWSCPHSRSEDGSEDLSMCWGGHHSPVRHWCAGGRCHRC